MCQTFLRVFSVKQTCILRSPLKGGGGWGEDYLVKKTGVFFVSNASLPVDVGRSKTPLLETPIYKKNTSAVILCCPSSSVGGQDGDGYENVS